MPGPASSTSGLEILKNMNVQTGKHATWVVRVLSPKLIRYQFTTRNKQVHASKFQCLLVSRDPRQFMLGSVPFSFASPDAPSKAFDRFKDGLTFSINTPEFDTKMKSEYMSTPLKRAVLLSAPTKIQAVPLTDMDRRNHPADHVDVGLSLQDVMQTLNTMRWTGTAGPASGSPGRTTQLMNLCGKIVKFDDPKKVQVAGKTRTVSSLELVDETQAAVEIHVWDDALAMVGNIPIGRGISIIGCAATRDENAAGTKLNMWDGAHVLQGGAKVQSLTDLATDGTGMRRLTAVFTPGQKGPLLSPDAEGLPTCAAALANAPKLQTDQIIQVNRCIIDATRLGCWRPRTMRT